ncbi:MAG: PqqD family protein [Zetaproteobacteria bacterium CG_4_9_14_3_um_filter_49_83]|nr:MAG: hypothetical protein AUJ56_12280 [Zetaproteobacteria bacterium CG1_02_49_23]PIQ31301.1 MAG: PqqD family protein [Zetaproteobacteria bacterium CG17_big_fil_post_rev_8_21_14_2_50_50_13]PIV30354.1 MAG: PqqD family protein [Zetaproteobacteria bacterium CG02_land_8_20_14_3_00_50_9]PIY55590.1 MAG: PqqD family protein [Zetaproteobacteria bacterium CG_4_10_14_0_8_um_filter_49_80]PJA35482.1 MAG: PqqD family protein [Zetaproteobacteria bacterium CG_4_9_14_3_um_filter_49_83]
MTITMDLVIKRNPEMVFSDMDGEIVMMSIERGEYYGMDAIGSEIWNMLDEEISVADICSGLCKRFDVEESICRQDVLAFLEQMAERNIILKA